MRGEGLMTTIASLIAAFVLIAGAIIGELLSWTDKLEKHPRLKKYAEAKALRAVLFFVAISLLAVVLRDVNGIREALNAPPSRQRPPAQVNLQDLVPRTAIQSAKAPATARPNNSGVSGSAIGGHDNAVAGSIIQQGRNNVAQNGINNTATINDIPPERRIKPEASTSVMPMLAASRARVNVRAPLGDNEAQQLGQEEGHEEAHADVRELPGHLGVERPLEEDVVHHRERQGGKRERREELARARRVAGGGHGVTSVMLWTTNSSSH